MFQLMIQAQGNPSPFLFKFNTGEEAFAAAKKAMDDGYYRTTGLLLIIGPGSLLNVLSDEEAGNARRNQEEAQRTGGLIQKGRADVKKEDFVLHIQMGMAQLPPLVYKTEEERTAVIDEVIKTQRLQYVFKDGQDHLFALLGSGIALMNLTGERYLAMRREAVEMMQKQMAAQAAQDPKLILPPGLRR